MHLKLSVHKKSPGDLAKIADLDSVDLRFCISNELPSNADTAGPV